MSREHRVGRVGSVAAMVLLVASAASPARADGPPAGTTESLTPPEAVVPPPAPTAVAGPAAPGSEPNEPVELLTVDHPSRVAAFIFAGAAVAGVAVGVGFGVAAVNQNNNYNTNPTTSGLGAAHQDSIVSDVGFGAAVIAGVTSVVLLLKKDDVTASPAVPAKTASATPGVTFSMTPLVSPHTAGAGVLVRF